MSLANLRKCAPSPSHQPLSVDDFIEQAELYANGQARVYTLPLHDVQNTRGKEKTFKRATFTLGETAISQLTQLSQQTGIAKSRLIRLWLAQQETVNFSPYYLVSEVK